MVRYHLGDEGVHIKVGFFEQTWDTVRELQSQRSMRFPAGWEANQEISYERPQPCSVEQPQIRVVHTELEKNCLKRG